MNVVSDASHSVCLAFAVAAYCCQISVHSRPNGRIKPRLSIFSAKNNVNEDLAQGLGHRNGWSGLNKVVTNRMRQAFGLQREIGVYEPGALPRAGMTDAFGVGLLT